MLKKKIYKVPLYIIKTSVEPQRAKKWRRGNNYFSNKNLVGLWTKLARQQTENQTWIQELTTTDCTEGHSFLPSFSAFRKQLDKTNVKYSIKARKQRDAISYSESHNL